MTAPDLIAELAEVVRLMGMATPGLWPAPTCPDASPNEALIHLGAGYIEFGGGRSRREANAEAVVALVNWFRTHAAEIEAMAKKAQRYDWLNAHRLDFIARNNMHEPRVYLPVGTDMFQPDAMDNTIDQAMRDSAREGGE